MYEDHSTDRYCVSDTTCRAYDHLAKHPAYITTRDYLCDMCLTVAERDVRRLVLDYVDLANLQDPSLSQALDSQPGGKPEPPIPLRTAPEALQAEIAYVTTLWADELRDRHRLSRRRPAVIVGAWHTTVTNPPPPARVRPGTAVQQAVETLAPRLRLLVRVEPVAVSRTGCDDAPEDVAGWQAVHHLQELHRRARGMLGRTHRTRQLPGTCPTCSGDLYQDDPREHKDPCPVYCATGGCGQQWSRDEYDQWTVDILLTPARQRTKAAA